MWKPLYTTNDLLRPKVFDKSNIIAKLLVSIEFTRNIYIFSRKQHMFTSTIYSNIHKLIVSPKLDRHIVAGVVLRTVLLRRLHGYQHISIKK